MPVFWYYLSRYYEMYLYNENGDHCGDDGFLLQNMVYQWYNKEKGDFLGCLGTNLGPPFFFQPSLQQSDKTWDAPMPSLLFWFLQACQILLSWKAKENIFSLGKIPDLMTHFLIYFSEANEVLENLVSKLLLKSNLLVKSFSFSPYFVGRQNRDFRHLLGRW